jgi:AraC family transcriptional regulator, regulatory protein of adaptative response / DNA-3-methyladenine glycosylase II
MMNEVWIVHNSDNIGVDEQRQVQSCVFPARPPCYDRRHWIMSFMPSALLVAFEVRNQTVSEILGLSPNALDRARTSRDPRFDGKFFTALTSTGVYCRPICPVRRPNGNIEYYRTAAAAAAAGYRPCLRCRPETAPGTPAWLGTSAVVRRALRLIEEGILDETSVDELAERLGIGSRHLHRLFIQHVGAPPLAVAQSRRLQRLHFAKRLLDETELLVREIALAAGFGCVRRFNAAFRQTYGRSPTELRGQRHQDSPEQNDVSLRLSFRPPYDWQQVRDFLAVSSVPGIERIDEGGYARTFMTRNGHGIIFVRFLAGENMLELRARNTTPAVLLQLTSSARRVFDLAVDPEKITLAFGSDPLLGPLVKRRPGLRIPGAWDPFECAVRAILEQQVNVAARRTLAGRLVARCGRQISSTEDGLTHLFPTPADLASANFTGLEFTRACTDAVQGLARAVADGKITFEGSIEEVIEALTAVPGIGMRRAQYLALRALCEPDAFPASDVILRRAAAMDGTPLPVCTLEKRAEAWRPWRGYAAMHLWCSMIDAEHTNTAT